MCGINAVINGSLKDIQSMVDNSSKRGIIQGITKVANSFVNFNWLPITDSTAKMQPFTSNNYTVWMNGFISNYDELAEKYNIKLESKCDTELLAKFMDKFKGKKLNELNGFFAVLYFNGFEWTTFTDKFGIKKLYEYRKENKIFIASEIKSILAACNEIEVDQTKVDQFKYDLGVMNQNSIYKGITRTRKLALVIPEKIKISYNDALIELKRLFIQSCFRNKTELNDCVFLSGGIDSGIIAKIMRPEYSFSMDYVDSKYSEIENIKLNSTGKHYSLICNKELFNEYSNKLIGCIQDPKVGSSYTNFALTEFASKFCTVIYSGAGGDEFFGGYPHRIDKPINQVIKRTSYNGPKYDVSHFDYDLKFLNGVLNIEDAIAGFHTMETRYPLLDNDLVDFALSLPDEYLKNKRILKDISGLHPDVINGGKKGFSNPYMTNDQWVEFIINQITKK